MATIYKEFIVEAEAARVWDALRDFNAVHVRLAPGFLTGCTVDAEGARVLTFANGLVAREVPVGIDDTHRRLAYTVAGGKASHHHASAQVFTEGPGRSRFV
ncbi:SRPBCC family protein [Variovorax sp. efr-133-TYG-130]|uniref:SRPBCC family protein n=1 Tax=Variovorax sp. efr-133-TYG-130 TaxID=3040327 RepID=UPI00255514C9|nr:SRPBCC family protein [Variovorax sp. efr-133-TYG-130]